MFNSTDRKFMKKALALAEKGLGVASPNPSVGCIIVSEGQIIGQGQHEYVRRDHAEIMALREAGARAHGATAYVTLEPCCHQGRTPPCTGRIIESGIRRVVVGRIDPNPMVSGKGIEVLRSAGIQVDAGLMAEEAGKIIETFACKITAGLPLVISKAGMSLDGKIGTAQNVDHRISSAEGREFGQLLRLRSDAILVGSGTVLSDDPELAYRGKIPKARPLIRVILDPELRTPPSARLFQSGTSAPVLLFCSREAPEKQRTALEKMGADIISVDCSEDKLDLHSVLHELGKKEISGVLVEGGSRIHWSFLSSNLVDVFYFIIAPLVLGGKDSVPSVGGEGYRSAAESLKFKIRKSFHAGPDLVLETYPSCSRSIISPWLSR
jgi:diaminohydroxyphosphoribosylaminopyrimidine deaminase / 5-amino-6-(5-phosphoribosylamino)uracil reductase